MKLSSYNWSSLDGTRGWCFGPWFKVLIYIIVPTNKGRYGLMVQFRKFN